MRKGRKNWPLLGHIRNGGYFEQRYLQTDCVVCEFIYVDGKIGRHYPLRTMGELLVTGYIKLLMWEVQPPLPEGWGAGLRQHWLLRERWVYAGRDYDPVMPQTAARRSELFKLHGWDETPERAPRFKIPSRDRC